MKASDIIKALEQKHCEDVTFTEMQFAGGRRIDFWAMPRSWSPMRTYGYEVKVSKRDFDQDEKWEEYRKSVHYLYFVCPWGLIKPEEVASGVGLMYLTNTGTRLVTKKKPVRNDVADFELMKCTVRGLWRQRPNLTPETRADRIARYKQNTENADAGRKVAALVQWKYSKALTSEIDRNDRLQREADLLKEVKEFCDQNNIPIGTGYRFQSRMEAIRRQLAGELSYEGLEQLKNLRRSLDVLLEAEDA